MTPTRRKPESWLDARKGYLVALVIALGSGWLAHERREGGMTVQVEIMERRMAALESRCDDG